MEASRRRVRARAGRRRRGRAAAARSTESRVGEALFFTTVMAPWNRSDGKLSRFTCEACHFEGYVDGRTHLHRAAAPSRDDQAAARPVQQPAALLARARPTMTTWSTPSSASPTGANGRDPWFALPPPICRGSRSAARRPPCRRRPAPRADDVPHGLLARPNPAVHGRATFTALERAGAELFRGRCESCHRARARSPSTAATACRSSAGSRSCCRRGADRVGRRRRTARPASSRTSSRRRAHAVAAARSTRSGPTSPPAAGVPRRGAGSRGSRAIALSRRRARARASACSRRAGLAARVPRAPLATSGGVRGQGVICQCWLVPFSQPHWWMLAPSPVDTPATSRHLAAVAVGQAVIATSGRSAPLLAAVVQPGPLSDVHAVARRSSRRRREPCRCCG